MIDPSIEKLLEKVDTRYEIIIAASKRARNLYKGAETTYDKSKLKPVTIAVKEINDNSIKCITSDKKDTLG